MIFGLQILVMFETKFGYVLGEISQKKHDSQKLPEARSI